MSLTHDFAAAPKQLSGLIDVHPPANFSLLEMQVKSDLRYTIDDSGEDVEAEYMLEMPLDCAATGTETVSMNASLYTCHHLSTFS